MAKRADFIAALRTYLGVPFRHQGVNRGGVDCYGLLYAAARDIGIESDMVPYYAAKPNGTDFEFYCEKLMEPLPYNRLQQATPGDVISFWISRQGEPMHLAVYSGKDRYERPCVIHAFARGQHGVVEMPVAQTFMSRRIHRFWRITELEN